MAITDASAIDTPATPHLLGEDESRTMFDAMARDLLGMTGEEFLERWNAGEFSDADAPGNSDVMYLAMLVARDE